MDIKVRDTGNGAPWCWQSKAVTRLIRANYEGKRLTTSIAIYQSITEICSNNTEQSTFNAYYSQIAILAGKSISTIKIYCNDFIQLGILAKNNRFIGKRNLSNEWILLTPSVSNNKQTSGNDNNTMSGNNNKPVIEESLLEESNLEEKSVDGEDDKNEPVSEEVVAAAKRDAYKANGKKIINS